MTGQATGAWMYWWVGVVTIVLGAAVAGTIFLRKRFPDFDSGVSTLQSLATAAALMFAGYWFLYERKGQPQANTRLEVVGLKIAPGIVALQARFTLTNLGTTLLDVGTIDVRLQQMNVDSLPLTKLLALRSDAFPEYIDGNDAYDDGVLMWPTIRRFKGGGPRSVEPGESDVRVVDMIASCSNTALHVLFMMNRPGSDQMWIDQATLGMTSLCAKDVGSKEVWSNAAGR